MDFLKYLLGGEGGVAGRMRGPDGSLPKRPFDHLMQGIEQNGMEPGQSSIDIPLHVAMQNKGIPYSSWPQAAKDELSPAMRKAYEDDLAKQHPGLYAGNSGPSREAAKQALLMTAAEKGSSQPNPYMQALTGSTENTRTRMGADTNNLGAQQQTGMSAGLMGGRGQTWDDVYQKLQIQLSTGQITQEEAKAQMDEAMRKNRADRRVNPFG